MKESNMKNLNLSEKDFETLENLILFAQNLDNYPDQEDLDRLHEKVFN